MSRSFKRTPICGITTAVSEKQDKRLANRKLRSKTRSMLNVAVKADSSGVLLPSIREVSNVWSFDKDGKQWLDRPTSKDMRK